MYKCACCNKNIGPGIAENKVVVKQREVSYTNIIIVTDDDGKEKKIKKTSSGTQIVKEVKRCNECCVANDIVKSCEYK